MSTCDVVVWLWVAVTYLWFHPQEGSCVSICDTVVACPWVWGRFCEPLRPFVALTVKRDRETPCGFLG